MGELVSASRSLASTLGMTVLAVLMVVSASNTCRAQQIVPRALPDNTRPSSLDGIGIEQKLDTAIPADIIFNDENGNPVRLGDLMTGERPVVLSLVYFECPMLCTVVLNDMLRGFISMPLTIGKDYDVITVSFDPKETSQLAAAKKREYLRKYSIGDRANSLSSAQRGWHFLTGNAQSIAALTAAVGFSYKWDDATNQFLHPAGITIITPSGKIARYFFGIDYEPKDLRLSLVEASQNKIGSFTDHVMLYCFAYDATTGKYGLAIMRGVRAAGVLTTVALVGGIMWMLRRERTRGEVAMRQRTDEPTALCHSECTREEFP